MPIIEVHLFKGHPAQVRTRLINAMTDAFRMVIQAPPASITVLLHELEQENFMRGGAMRRRVVALREPISVLQDYIKAMESRDLDLAQKHLTDDCQIFMPGGEVFTSPAIIWFQARVRKMDFKIIGSGTSAGEQGPTVLIRMAMSGQWLDGTPFADVRMAAKFEFHGNQIRQIDMWTDLAEHALARGGYGVRPPDVPDTDSAGH